MRLAVPIHGGYIEVDELALRPGLGVELDLELVRSRPRRPLPAGRHPMRDGATPLY